MELSKYEVFLKTVELGNITQAAEFLGYTQPAVSRVIADLEREWGVPLLIRGRVGVSLTPEGKHLLPRIRSVCAAQRELENSVDELLGLEGGAIRVGAFHSVAIQWLPQIIRSFLELYPKMDIQLTFDLEYSSVESMLIKGEVDCAFLTLPLNLHTKPPLCTRFRKRDPLCAVLPIDHPLAHADCYPISRFAQDDFIPIQETRDRDMTNIFTSCNVKPNIRYYTKDSYTIASLVESGLGVSIMSELMLGRIPYRVACIPLDPPQYRDIATAVRPGPLSPAVSRFLEHACLWVSQHAS